MKKILISVVILTLAYGGYEYKSNMDKAKKIALEKNLEIAKKVALEKRINNKFDKLITIIKIGQKYSSIKNKKYKTWSKKCFGYYSDSDSNACFSEQATKANYAATNEVGYSVGEITRKTQKILYELQNLGVSDPDVRKKLGRYELYVYGGCCDGSLY